MNMTNPYKLNLDRDNQTSTGAAVWRLIPFMQASGHWHMAVDEWLLEQHRLGVLPSVIRFYSWSPAAISLGYHQRRYPEGWSQLVWQGETLELVRRPTGGRAVLHQGDLTYAIVTSGLSDHRLEAYQQLCQLLIEGWRSLKVELHYGQAHRSYIHSPNCFAAATGADLVLPNGVKLIGSAQLRRGRCLLQHGSMRLGTDPLLFRQVFETELPSVHLPFSPEPATCIPMLIDALVAACKRCLGVHVVTQPLTTEELQDIQQYYTSRTQSVRANLSVI
jgi:lipoate-protein ligase A